MSEEEMFLPDVEMFEEEALPVEEVLLFEDLLLHSDQKQSTKFFQMDSYLQQEFFGAKMFAIEDPSVLEPYSRIMIIDGNDLVGQMAYYESQMNYVIPRPLLTPDQAYELWRNSYFGKIRMVSKELPFSSQLLKISCKGDMWTNEGVGFPSMGQLLWYDEISVQEVFSAIENQEHSRWKVEFETDAEDPVDRTLRFLRAVASYDSSTLLFVVFTDDRLVEKDVDLRTENSLTVMTLSAKAMVQLEKARTSFRLADLQELLVIQLFLRFYRVFSDPSQVYLWSCNRYADLRAYVIPGREKDPAPPEAYALLPKVMLVPMFVVARKRAVKIGLFAGWDQITSPRERMMPFGRRQPPSPRRKKARSPKGESTEEFEEEF